MSCVASAFEFYGTEAKKKLSIRLSSLNRAAACKDVLSVEATDLVSVDLPASPANIVLTLSTTPPVVVESLPLGKISVLLDTAQLSTMISGSIVVTITKTSGEKIVAVAEAACKRLTIPIC